MGFSAFYSRNYFGFGNDTMSQTHLKWEECVHACTCKSISVLLTPNVCVCLCVSEWLIWSCGETSCRKHSVGNAFVFVGYICVCVWDFRHYLTFVVKKKKRLVLGSLIYGHIVSVCAEGLLPPVCMHLSMYRLRQRHGQERESCHFESTLPLQVPFSYSWEDAGWVKE